MQTKSIKTSLFELPRRTLTPGYASLMHRLLKGAVVDVGTSRVVLTGGPVVLAFWKLQP